MFTGIIEHIGQIASLTKHDHGITVGIISDVFGPKQIGKSFAINGVCLTQTRYEDSVAYFDVVFETLDKTNLALLNKKEPVHVETSLKVGDSMDGHMVQGHVDGVAQVESIDQGHIKLKLPSHLKKYVISKGSVALDGVSLTVAKIEDDLLTVALIPHTYQTTLFKSKLRSEVNIEIDPLAKTLFKYLDEINLQEVLQ